MSIMLSKSFSLLFYLKKPKKYVNGSMPIYMRITVDGIPKEISLGRKCEPLRWNTNTGRATGTKEETKKLNEFLNTVQTKVYEARRQLIEKSGICAHNTAMKYLGDLKKIVLICVKRGWLLKDPFLGYKMRRRNVEKDFLVDNELSTISAKEFATERLRFVRDIFLFSCFTGLAYADVKKLKHSEIRIGIDGKKWLFIQRQKSTTSSPVPLLPKALQILDKYRNHPKCQQSDKALPIFSNQKMNEYLKEIADVCGIPKRLTYHTARHTFATTVTLNNDVPIESVSKMMGHKSLKQTQHYAKILNKKVSEDMQLLSVKLKAV